MSKIIRTRKPSVLPYYAAALAFVVLCAVLPVYRLWALLAALGAAVLAFAGAKKICPPHCGSGGSHPRQGKAGAAVRQLLSA